MDASSPLFPVFVVAVWIGLSCLVAHMSGWARLAEKYRCDDSHIGSWNSWQSGKIGIADYKNCLWIAAAAEGLYLKTGPLFLFRAFHPPLRIPWSAIKGVEERKLRWMRTFEMKLHDPDLKVIVEASALSDGQRFLGDKLKLERRSSE